MGALAPDYIKNFLHFLPKAVSLLLLGLEAGCHALGHDVATHLEDESSHVSCYLFYCKLFRFSARKSDYQLVIEVCENKVDEQEIEYSFAEVVVHAHSFLLLDHDLHALLVLVKLVLVEHLDVPQEVLVDVVVSVLEVRGLLGVLLPHILCLPLLLSLDDYVFRKFRTHISLEA